VKLTRVSKDQFSLQLGGREKSLLLELLRLYPRVPSNYLAVSKMRNLPDSNTSQKLLDDALAEQRADNKRQLQALMDNPGRWSENQSGFQLALSATEIDWLLQVLNDIRIGSWLILGSPEERFEVVNPETAPHLWAMETAGLFQMYLLHALQSAG
jgi:hypothetical protein